MSNIKTLVTQAIDVDGDAKAYTTPFRTTIERVRRGDIVAYIGKGRDRSPVVEYLMEVSDVTKQDSGAVTVTFTDGNFREAMPGLPLTVARHK